MLGQADDLASGVYRKRLGKNLYHPILVARAGRFCVYEYVFAKRDRANIDDAELENFRKIAKTYGTLTMAQISLLIERGSWEEICNEN